VPALVIQNGRDQKSNAPMNTVRNAHSTKNESGLLQIGSARACETKLPQFAQPPTIQHGC